MDVNTFSGGPPAGGIQMDGVQQLGQFSPWKINMHGTCPHRGLVQIIFLKSKWGDGCMFQPLIFQGCMVYVGYITPPTQDASHHYRMFSIFSRES